MTDWSGGYDKLRLQDFSRQQFIEPLYWDAQNMDPYSIPGTLQLASGTYAIDTQDSADREYLIYPFNLGVYRIPTANWNAATDVKSIKIATGTPTWGALANVYPGAEACNNAVVWRDQFIVAPQANILRVMSTSEVWTTLAAPAGIGGNAGQVGVFADDRLACWWESAGLYAYDGTNWTKIFPAAAVTAPADPFCDLIIRASGSTVFITRDTTGLATIFEHIVLSTGTQIQPWLKVNALKVWPQGAAVYQNALYICGRLGSAKNIGVLYRKDQLQSPNVIRTIDTNYATDGQQGQDWSWRCLHTTGDAMWIGGSSRQDRTAALYRYELDPAGQESIHPNVNVTGVNGPIYSIATLPYLATGASTQSRLYYTLVKQTYYKDPDNLTAATLDAPNGWLQFPDVDLGVEDHLKVGRFIEAYLRNKSAGGTVDIQYRIDPQKLSESWRSFGFCNSQGLTHIGMPDDNVLLGKYGLSCRTLQIRVYFQRASSGSLRDVLDTFAVDFAQILPLSSSNA